MWMYSVLLKSLADSLTVFSFGVLQFFFFFFFLAGCMASGVPLPVFKTAPQPQPEPRWWQHWILNSWNHQGTLGVL